MCYQTLDITFRAVSTERYGSVHLIAARFKEYVQDIQKKKELFVS